MNKYFGLAATIAVAGTLAACGGKTETHSGHVEGEAPHAAAPAPAVPTPTPEPAAPPAAMAAPSPMHGGQMIAGGNYFAEIEASADEVEGYFYDAKGQHLTGAAVANVTVQISMSDGHRAKADLKPHETHYTTGDNLKNKHLHTPYDGVITAMLNGEEARFRFTTAGGGKLPAK